MVYLSYTHSKCLYSTTHLFLFLQVKGRVVLTILDTNDYNSSGYDIWIRDFFVTHPRKSNEYMESCVKEWRSMVIEVRDEVGLQSHHRPQPYFIFVCLCTLHIEYKQETIHKGDPAPRSPTFGGNCRKTATCTRWYGLDFLQLNSCLLTRYIWQLHIMFFVSYAWFILGRLYKYKYQVQSSPTSNMFGIAMISLSVLTPVCSWTSDTLEAVVQRLCSNDFDWMVW